MPLIDTGKIKTWLWKNAIIVLATLGVVGAIWLTQHELSSLRKENAELTSQVEGLNTARRADRAASAVVERRRTEAAEDHARRAERLSEAAVEAPDWAAEPLPESVREALR